MQLLLDQLKKGATVITPNNRLSALLLEDYYKAQGAKPVKKPPCIPYRSFITQCYKQFVQTKDDLCHPLLLTDIQSQYLWRKLLQTQPEFTYSEGLLSAVIDAWNNCLLWNLSPEALAFCYTPQTLQFQKWWQLFNQELITYQAITEHQIIEYLITHDASILKHALIWACFDSFTPQQKQLQAYLEDRGFAQKNFELSEKLQKSFQFSTKNAESEREQVILFLQERLAQKDQRIAVVVPDLEQQALSLQRQLLKHLPVESFNISLGKSLKDYPLVGHALQWLALDLQLLTNHQARLFLYSPYLKASETEFYARTQFMQDATILQKPLLEQQAFVDALKKSVPILAKCLESLPSYPKTASCKVWVEHFKTRLELLGFPGEYGLASENYQCFNRFLELLETFKQLGLFTPHMHAKEALAALGNIAAKTIFQAQTTDKPIQILGLLEASGCQFDSLWVMGLTDQCLPQKTQLTPFIPHDLQRSMQMPHALPAKELQLAKSLLQRLQFGSKLCVFSYPLLSADSPNLPCPLITHLPFFSEKTPHPPADLPLIRYAETYQYPLLPNESIRGGTQLLANQAICPFKAFAAHRLHARSALKIQEGLDLSNRGQLIHAIMEAIWQDLGNQETLLALSQNALEQRIENAIRNALAPLSLSNFIQNLELKRLKNQVRACLDWEKQRETFSVIALEKAYTIPFNALMIQVRVDRIDETPDGNKWVIDYKSTLPMQKPWYEERPKEPQLLLYALLDETITTLLFLELKAGKVAVCGFSEAKEKILGISQPKKDQSFSEQRKLWQHHLHVLADEFSRGNCAPQPLSSSECQLCDFQNLCRFNAN